MSSLILVLLLNFKHIRVVVLLKNLPLPTIVPSDTALFLSFVQCCTSKVCGALLFQLSSHPLTLWPSRKLASALRRLVILLLQITNWPLTQIQRTFLSSSWSVMCLQFWHWWPQHDNNTIYWILHARYCANNLTHITSFNPHKKIR